MVEWLAGNRIRGTTAERPNFGLPSGSVGGWKEVARVKSNDTDVIDIPDKRYLMVLSDHGWNTSNAGIGMQINGDTSASQYPRRYSDNGGTDATPTTETNIFYDTMGGGTQTGKRWFMVQHIANKSDKEKLIQYSLCYNKAGLTASYAPNRVTGVAKWVNTSASINRLDLRNFNSGTITSDSEVVVLGWDPADTHTTNFWEELTDKSWTSGNAITTDTFTTKKYLWIQGWYTQSGTSGHNRFRVGNGSIDTGSNYAQRYSINGGTDVATGGASLNLDNLWAVVGQGSDAGIDRCFFNVFIVNNAANEKLMISHNVWSQTDGAGTAPERTESVCKWTNTSDQINIAEININGSGSFSGGQIKVWGSD